MLLKVGNRIKHTRDMTQNLKSIEEFIKETYPVKKLHQDLYLNIKTTATQTWSQIVQDVVKQVTKCNFLKQTSLQIIIVLMIANCGNVEVNKWINSKIETLVAFQNTQEFVNFTHKGHIEMITNTGLPGYIGFRSRAANINEVGGEKKRIPREE